MRVYLPATLPTVRAALAAGEFGPAPLTGFAVTPSLREWYAEGDLEELEYAALTEAARASLRLLDADPDAVRRRVVIAAELPDAEVRQRPDLDRAVVEIGSAVPIAKVVSAHVDDDAAREAVAAAADAVIAADLGDDDAQFAVDEAEGHELQWYATQELAGLVGGG
jgi:hypothetical protein